MYVKIVWWCHHRCKFYVQHNCMAWGALYNSIKVFLGRYSPNVLKSDLNISSNSKMYGRESCQKLFTKKPMREMVVPKEQMIPLIEFYKILSKYFADGMELSWEKLTWIACFIVKWMKMYGKRFCLQAFTMKPIGKRVGQNRHDRAYRDIQNSIIIFLKYPVLKVS